MSIFIGVKTKIALSRLQEEQVFEFILNELEAGIIRRGLMAKAMTLGHGDEGKIQGEYIKLRYQSLIDENTVMEAIESIVGTNPKRAKRRKTAPEPKPKEPSLPSYESRVARQEEFSLKPIKKGKHDNFWNNLASEFKDARKEDGDS